MGKQNGNSVRSPLRPSLLILWILMASLHKQPPYTEERGKLIDYNVFESVYTLLLPFNIESWQLRDLGIKTCSTR